MARDCVNGRGYVGGYGGGGYGGGRGVSSMVTSLAIVRKAETLVPSAINVKRMATLQLAAMLKRERMLN
ncbi:hypothetical protein X801_10656 [Opisthorchis viverrini]|uniref:Uncharacterized protein n=1 Tax=Opisthorchis viverrini TaxID=6198 RepID=A0A1S8WGJ0_OPIVI|nr:hypothetical protein X801_10656 [Opisthorchis viverrini]